MCSMCSMCSDKAIPLQCCLPAVNTGLAGGRGQRGVGGGIISYEPPAPGRNIIAHDSCPRNRSCIASQPKHAICKRSAAARPEAGAASSSSSRLKKKIKKNTDCWAFRQRRAGDPNAQTLAPICPGPLPISELKNQSARDIRAFSRQSGAGPSRAGPGRARPCSAEQSRACWHAYLAIINTRSESELSRSK